MSREHLQVSSNLITILLKLKLIIIWLIKTSILAAIMLIFMTVATIVKNANGILYAGADS